MKKNRKLTWIYGAARLGLILTAFLALLGFTYRFDNKYTAGPPYGKDGTFYFREDDLSKPLFLIDGWEFYPDQLLTPGESGVNSECLFIGQFPSFAAFSEDKNPFGKGTYRLTLLSDDVPRILTLEIPEIFTSYSLWVDDQLVSEQKGATSVTFLMNQTAVLTLQTENHTHYYSGLTYPPALGTPAVMQHLFLIRTLFYVTLCLVPLTLALFSMALWMAHGRDILFRHFGMLCLCFFIPVLHPFIWQFHLSGRLWYALEDAMWFFMLSQALAIASVSAGFYHRRLYQSLIHPLSLALPIVCFLFVCVVIPHVTSSITWYQYIVKWCRMGCWGYFILCAAKGFSLGDKGSLDTLAGGVCLGFGLFSNILDDSCYEPVYGGWQLEYAGFFLVLIFGGLMVRHTLTLLHESEQLKLATLQNKLARESALKMRQNVKQVRSLKHELIHHIDVMESFCRIKDYVRLEDYFSEIRKEKEALAPLYYCDNYLVNAILSSHFSDARQKGIKVQCRALLPLELGIPDTELCILFSNLLDNALEACERLPEDSERLIELDLGVKNQLLTVLCRNPAPQTAATSHAFATTKQHPEEHGFGLRAMAKIAEKHEGGLDLSEENGVITIKLLLHLPADT